jgi:ketosteroid isomerase-like protein
MLVGVLAGCQQPAPAGLSDADKAAIKAVTDSALVLGNAATKDWAAYTALYYAEDAIVLPPNAEPVGGREAITALLQAFPPISNWEFAQVDVDGVGDFAYVRGTYAFDVTPPGMPGPVHDHGKYIEIWRRQADGSWKVIRDIFNTSVPLPTPAAVATP